MDFPEAISNISLNRPAPWLKTMSRPWVISAVTRCEYLLCGTPRLSHSVVKTTLPSAPRTRMTRTPLSAMPQYVSTIRSLGDTLSMIPSSNRVEGGLRRGRRGGDPAEVRHGGGGDALAWVLGRDGKGRQPKRYFGRTSR